MAYSITLENDLAFLKKDNKNLGYVDLKLLNLSAEDLGVLGKLKFNKMQEENYDFSTRVRGYIKDDKKDKLYFNFEAKNCEIYMNIKDGKLYDAFDQEIPAGKVSGNFRRIISDDKYAKNFVSYLTSDVLNHATSPSMKTALQKIKYDNHLECIQKVFKFGCYLRQYDLMKINLDNVTKDVVDILKAKMEAEGTIPSNILATTGCSKKYHESYVKYLKEDNKVYFDLLYSHKNKYSELVSHFNYDEISLVDYITRVTETQNMGLNDAVTCLYDYANMHNLMEVPKFDKYPRYLRSMHDIVVMKFNAYKKDNNIPLTKMYGEDLYRYTSKTDKFYKYRVEIPSTTADIIEEGKIMRHCVASYVDRVIAGDTKIVFLRLKDYLGDNRHHLLTLQITGDALVQAKGKCNRSPEADEVAFLKEYCEVKSLQYSV